MRVVPITNTHLNQSSKSWTAPDVLILPEEIQLKPETTVSFEKFPLLSDHCPVLWYLPLLTQVQKNSVTRNPRWNFKKCNKGKFITSLSHKAQHSPNFSLMTPGEINNFIVNAIIRTCKKTVPNGRYKEDLRIETQTK